MKRTLQLLLTVAMTVLLSGALQAAGNTKSATKSKQSASQEIQYDAVQTIKDALIDAREEAQGRAKYLTKFIEAQGLTKKFETAKLSPGKKMSKVPLTFDEAMDSVIADIQEHGSKKLYADDVDKSMLSRQLRAERDLTARMWQETYPELKLVDQQVQFLQQEGKWDEFLRWVDIEKQQEAATREKKDKELRAEAGVREKEDREKARQERIERNQQEWDRKVKSYELKTDRDKANRPINYYYGGDDWDDDRYHQRWDHWGDPYIRTGKKQNPQRLTKGTRVKS